MSRHSARGRPWKRIRAAVLAESDVCWLCGQPGADEVDHVRPVSAGGEPLDRSNLRPAHGVCNRRRGAGPPRPRMVHSRDWWAPDDELDAD